MAFSLKCNISIEVNDLVAGMRLALKDDREKRCALPQRIPADISAGKTPFNLTSGLGATNQHRAARSTSTSLRLPAAQIR